MPQPEVAIAVSASQASRTLRACDSLSNAPPPGRDRDPLGVLRRAAGLGECDHGLEVVQILVGDRERLLGRLGGPWPTTTNPGRSRSITPISICSVSGNRDTDS